MREKILRSIALFAFIYLVSLSPAPVSSASAPSLPLGKPQWMSVLFQGEKIGYHTSTLLPTEEGFQLRQRTFLRFKLLNRPQAVLIRSRILADSKLALRSFSFMMDADPSHYEIEGMSVPDGLKLTTTTPHGTSESFLPYSGKIYMDELLPALIASRGLATGAKMSIKTLEPLTRKLDSIEIKVRDRERVETNTFKGLAHKVEIDYPSHELTLWMDDSGAIQRELSASGLELVGALPENARKGLSEDDPLIDIARLTQPKKTGRLEDPVLLRSLTVLLRGIKASSYDLDGGRQIAQGDRVRIDLEDVDGVITYTIPYRGEEFSMFLQPETFIQSLDETIRDQSFSIIGDERNAFNVVRLVCAWVYENITKEPILSVPDALEVLKLRRGDCNEHAVLTAALLRSVGIPARVSTGLVYNDGGFYYHAWNEAFVGEWISLDSTSNQIPADVSHIRLIEGGIEHQSRLMNVIGALKIDILSSE